MTNNNSFNVQIMLRIVKIFLRKIFIITVCFICTTLCLSYTLFDHTQFLRFALLFMGNVVAFYCLFILSTLVYKKWIEAKAQAFKEGSDSKIGS
jgi:uncharacterized membrane protein